MDGENEKKPEETPVDPWAAAFAALEQKDQETSAPASDDGGAAGEDGQRGPAEADGGSAAEAVPDDNSGDAPVGNGDAVGDGATAGEDGGSDGQPSYSDEEVEASIKDIEDKVQNQAINDVAQAMKQSGKIRVTRDGKLGASINDPDIYTKDEDGVVTYVNPETGRPFSGDNPRAQAKQWVEDYNKELEQAFNKIAEQRVAELKKEQEPVIRTLKFAKTYEGLNDVQRDMLDSIIEDYEVKDKDGNAIGYSCDLDKALAQVNRQIAKLTSRGQSMHSAQPKPEPTSPAVDMPQSTTSGENKPPEFKNLAEAMSWQQDQLLKKRGK